MDSTNYISELRLNNSLYLNDKIVSITSIQIINNKTIVKVDNLEKICDNLVPILITPNLLHKLNFSLIYQSNSRIRYDMSNSCYFDFDFEEKGVCKGFLYKGNYINCKYLHQLENIYSMLVGENITKKNEALSLVS